jgi:hypothetical protein
MSKKASILSSEMRKGTDSAVTLVFMVDSEASESSPVGFES